MYGKAATWCFIGAFLVYLWRICTRMQTKTLRSAIRVRHLRGLGELVGDSNSSLLVAVCGKVGSMEAFKSHRSGLLGVNLIEKARIDFSTMNEAGTLVREYEEVVLSRKKVPWLLDDNTGRVNAVGFDVTFRRDVFDEPVDRIFSRILYRKGVMVHEHTCSEDILEIGTPLTIVGKAFRDRDGAPLIRAPSYQVYNEYINIDHEILKLESHTVFIGYLSLFLAGTGVFLLLLKEFLRYQ